MIILKNVPFEKRAQFLYDNVCSYPDNPEFDTALAEHGVDMAAGLKAHLDLLRAIYADVIWIEGKNDRARYLEIVSTITLLYVFLAFGSLVEENGRYTVLIPKDVLNANYKKGSLGKKTSHLARHGLAVQYLAGRTACASLSTATHLSIATNRAPPSLLPAAYLLAQRIASMAAGHSTSTVLYGGVGMFIKGDCEAAILNRPPLRDALDPFRSDILRTVGEYKLAWLDLAGALRGACGLDCSGFFHYGASPSWSVSFAEKRKKPLAIFTLGASIVFIEFTLPVDAAERIILERNTYSDLIRGKIEAFHCVKCPKTCKGSNLVKIDGVLLCTGRAEARRIYATLVTPHDFQSIQSMLDIIYE